MRSAFVRTGYRGLMLALNEDSFDAFIEEVQDWFWSTSGLIGVVLVKS